MKIEESRSYVFTLPSGLELRLTNPDKCDIDFLVKAFNHKQDDNWPECEMFFNLMQAYRHAPIEDQSTVANAYEAVKDWLSTELKRDK